MYSVHGVQHAFILQIYWMVWFIMVIVVNWVQGGATDPFKIFKTVIASHDF